MLSRQAVEASANFFGHPVKIRLRRLDGSVGRKRCFGLP
jgi:hypothetical protein